MNLSELSKSELEETLKNLRRLYEAARRSYEKKYIEYQAFGRELNAIAESAKTYRASIMAVEKDLRLSSEQIPLPEGEVSSGVPADATKTGMRLVAGHKKNGGGRFC